MTPPARSTRSRPGGFTLTEVLISLAVLAIGLVAVASLFPAGLLLQREAVKSTLRQSHVRSIDALLTGVNLDNGVLLRFTDLIDDASASPTPEALSERGGLDDALFDVYAVAEVDRSVGSGANTDMSDPSGPAPGSVSASAGYAGQDSYLANFPLSIRTLPTSTPARLIGSPPASAFAPDPDYSTREVLWVPLVRRGLEASDLFRDWSGYAFVLQPPADLMAAGAYAWGNYPGWMRSEVSANPFDPAYFPKVFRLPVGNVPNDQSEARFFDDVRPHLRVGDPVLGDNGTLYTISRIDAADGEVVGLNADNNYLPLNQRELNALWVAPALEAGQNSPVAEVRLLSNTVVRLND